METLNLKRFSVLSADSSFSHFSKADFFFGVAAEWNLIRRTKKLSFIIFEWINNKKIVFNYRNLLERSNFLTQFLLVFQNPPTNYHYASFNSKTLKNALFSVYVKVILKGP